MLLAGNSGRLLEMLHGSDGWEKLVSELHQKEEQEAQQQAIQEDQAQQQPPAGGRKRGRAPGDISDPNPKELRLFPVLKNLV